MRADIESDWGLFIVQYVQLVSFFWRIGKSTRLFQVAASNAAYQREYI